jgi:hypothetical protein
MKVYAVFSGSYSGRDLDAIFSTKELAEKYIKKQQVFGNEYEYGDVDSNPTEYEMDSPVVFEYCYYKFINKKLLPYKGYVDPNIDDDVFINYDNDTIIKVKYNDDTLVSGKAAIDKYFAWLAMKEGI